MSVLELLRYSLQYNVIVVVEGLKEAASQSKVENLSKPTAKFRTTWSGNVFFDLCINGETLFSKVQNKIDGMTKNWLERYVSKVTIKWCRDEGRDQYSKLLENKTISWDLAGGLRKSNTYGDNITQLSLTRRFHFHTLEVKRESHIFAC